MHLHSVTCFELGSSRLLTAGTEQTFSVVVMVHAVCMVGADSACLFTVQRRREQFGALLQHLDGLQGTLNAEEANDGATEMQQG